MLNYIKENRRGKLWAWLGKLFGAVKSYGTKTKPDPKKCNCKPVYTLGSSGPRAVIPGNYCGRREYEGDNAFHTKFEKTYTSFSGMDFHFVLVPHGGKAYLGVPALPPKGQSFNEFDEEYRAKHPRNVVLEVQAVSFTKYHKDPTKNGRNVIGNIIATFFDRESILNSLFEGKNDIVLLGSNEYGHQVQIRIKDVEITKSGMAVSVNDLMLDMSYEFTAHTVEFKTYEYKGKPKPQVAK